MRGVNNMFQVSGMFGRVRKVGSTAILACSLVLLGSLSVYAVESNRLESVGLEQGAAVPTILIQSAEPVGYRYTVYDSTEPIRVVVDFPGMELANVDEVVPLNLGPLQELHVAKFDLSSGKLARVEVVLSRNVEYQVSLDEKDFRISFPDVETADVASTQPPAAEPVAAEIPAAAPSQDATVLREIDLTDGKAVMATNGAVGLYKYFILNTPPRLVLDMYGVRPGFKDRTLGASAGFKQIRVGTYKDKTRLVFDAEGTAVPEHTVEKQDMNLVVAWGGAAAMSAPVTAAEPAAEVVEQEPVAAAAVVDAQPKKMVSGQAATLEALDFVNEEGRSEVVLKLTADADVTQPTQDGNLVRFEVKNCTLPRGLRRTIDASAFPSAVTAITPYTVKEGGKQNVRIAVELKGLVAYSLDDQGQTVRLVVDDGAFAEVSPPSDETVEIPVAAADLSAEDAELMGLEDPAIDEMTGEAEFVSPNAGQRISLSFDEADIGIVLQLIGDVSGLNIVASDDVKGKITLYLTDVPWEKALELLLETADLASVQDGNILRVMTAEKMREIDQARMDAEQDEVEEGVLETAVFQISYTSVDDMKKILEDIKSERGSIVPDSRNKQLIIKDVASILQQMEEMVAQVDKPEKQVMIEARIVEANDNFSREFGVHWNASYQNDASTISSQGLDTAQLGFGGSFFIPPDVINVAGVGSSFNFGKVGIDSLLLNLRINALESSGDVKIVSSPRITTLNGEAAIITQGTKIPYTTISDEGTTTEFESAELKLDVTPEINPDGSIILDIKASNSAVGQTVPTGVGQAIAIDEKKAETKVLIKDGETTVIGGIFVEDTRDSESGVPILKDIPFLGHLFKSTVKVRERRELLIFITPRILEV